ncbi:hypothetical protein [Streptomyces sp. NPDC006463]|uniref:hypothetical protein n=1 Tax=Streptomyces sp. NPDC006463 TaxID=3364746 RepID=UPI0036838A1B
MLAQHLHQVAAPVRSLRPEVPVELERLVAELLGKDPQQRPASAADVARRLRALPAASVRVAEAAVAAAAGAGTRPRTALAPRVVTPTEGVPRRQADRASRAPVWRAWAGTAALVGGQLAAFTAFPDTASALLGVLAGGCVAAGSRLEARHDDTHGVDSGQSVVGVFAALMVASVTMVVLLGWNAMPCGRRSSWAW